MALVNYMGDAPGFMSYSRARRTDSLRPPERARPAQEAPPMKNFDLDFEGNPGDKQWLYDRNNAFNSGLNQLYKEYGGEMDWVRADPRYKQLVAADANFVKNQQAAIQNRENTKARLQDLKNMTSGQANSDYELAYENGAFVAKKFDSKGNVVTKGDYAQDVIWNPQEVQHEDGSVGIGHTQFDYGTGTEQDWTNLMNKVFSGLGSTEWGNDNTRGSNFTENDASGLDFKMGQLVRNAASHKDNYQQVADATQYLIKYGFDKNQEYFMSQEMISDYEAGKAFTAPKITEDGTIETDAKGRPVLEQKYLTKEDISDPNRMKLLFNYYVQDRVSDYAKKYLAKSDQRTSVKKDDFTNVDPRTGERIIPEPELERWQARAANLGPKDPEYQHTSTVFVPDGKGGMKQKEMPGEYYHSGNDPQGIEQVKMAIKDKKIGDISPNGRVMVGGLWQNIGATDFKGLNIGDIKSVKQVLGEDGETMEYVAEVDVALHEDEEDFDNIMVWDPSTKKKVPIVNATWLGYDYTTSEGEQNQVIRWETKQNLIDQGIHINDNYDHWGWDGPDAKVATIHVPIKSIIDNLDQYGVGQSQENKNRMNIEVGGSVRQTLQGQQMESFQEQEFLNAGKIGN